MPSRALVVTYAVLRTMDLALMTRRGWIIQRRSCVMTAANMRRTMNEIEMNFALSPIRSSHDHIK